MKKQLDQLNREHSVLKDQFEECKETLKNLDNYYKEIIDEKDNISDGYLKITSKDQEQSKKLKRLLTKFRSERELSLVKELKEIIEKDVDT